MSTAWKPTSCSIAHFPLSSSSRKWRQSLASQSQRRTPNSLKVNETYKRGAPAIHLNPQSNLLSQQRQTSPCAPSAILGITNYVIFCPAYVPLCRHVHHDRLSYNGTCPIYRMPRWCSAGVNSVICVRVEFNAFTLHHAACREWPQQICHFNIHENHWHSNNVLILIPHE